MDAKVKTKREARPQKTGGKAARAATFQYQPGFGNQFVSEAVPGALPVGRNSPQKPPHGLYAELISGTAFTAPRHENRRTWTYRIRPSVVHRPYKRIDNGLIRSAPFDDVEATPSQLRWSPFPIPKKATDFVAGHHHARRQRQRGDPDRHGGAHLRRQHVDDRPLLLQCRRRDAGAAAAGPRPLRHRARHARDLAGRDRDAAARACASGSSCRTGRRAATSARTTARRCGCPSSARSARTASPIRAISSRRSRPIEDKEAPCTLVAKFQGNLWAAEMKHSPLNVVAWHGNFTPYKYDLARFMVIGTVSFDHPDPSIYSVLTAPSDTARRRQYRLRDLPAALAGRRGHVPAALVPPQRHDRVHGPALRRATTPRRKASCPAAPACTTA